MKNTTKTLMVCLIMAVAIVMVSSAAIAQFGFLEAGGVWGLLNYPAFTQQSLVVPTQSSTTGDILIDNFEYWDSPYNHGWKQIEPSYPVYGFGQGYATIFNTILDMQEGSRVLDVYRPSSIFLLGPPNTAPYARHAIRYPCAGCLGFSLDPTSGTPILSFKFRAPIGIESFDIFEFRVYDSSGQYVRIVPLQTPCNNCITGACAYPAVKGTDGNWTISIGRDFLDGTWHVVWVDLYNCTNGEINDVCILEASGQMFRLDDITLRKADVFVSEPYLFKIGPRYAQFYEPYAFLFYADYRDYTATPTVSDLLLMDANLRRPNDSLYSGLPMSSLFETDPNAIKAYWQSLSYDPNYGYATDANHVALDPNTASHYGQPDPTISAALGRDFVVYESLPIFKDARLRMDFTAPNGVTNNPAFVPAVPTSTVNQTLLWNATVGGLGASGIEFEGLSPLQINIMDGMPTYIPVYGPEKTAAVTAFYQVPFLGPNVVPLLEGALMNAGFTFWPNIAVMNFTPYVFEDIILTIEVSNGRASDIETFPIEVVNYPVENYPPYIEDVDDQLFPVGVQSIYALSVIDPDCTIFSMAQFSAGSVPATTHVPWSPFIPLSDAPRTDMSDITWSMTLNGLPSYQYGPWMQSMINAKSGLVNFNPQFEGAYDAVVVATDAMGASGIQEFTIFSVMQGTWLNHPPIIMMDWDHPQVCNAGEEFILTTPEIQVVDPDGDEIYYSCNIGSCGRRSNGDFMWTFTSNFPGFYTAEIIAYDIRGGYAIITIDLQVKPWWSF